MEVIVHPRLDDQALMLLRQEADVLLFPSAAEVMGTRRLNPWRRAALCSVQTCLAHNELMPEGACLRR